MEREYQKDKFTKSVWSDDIYRPATEEPVEGVIVTPLSDWLPTGQSYQPAGMREGKYEITRRVVLLIAPDGGRRVVAQERFWHGGWASGSEWITLIPAEKAFADWLDAWTAEEIDHDVLCAAAVALGWPLVTP